MFKVSCFYHKVHNFLLCCSTNRYNSGSREFNQLRSISISMSADAFTHMDSGTVIALKCPCSYAFYIYAHSQITNVLGCPI